MNYLDMAAFLAKYAAAGDEDNALDIAQRADQFGKDNRLPVLKREMERQAKMSQAIFLLIQKLEPPC